MWDVELELEVEHWLDELTVFRKQRQNERTEIRRARKAMTRCITENHTAEEDQ